MNIVLTYYVSQLNVLLFVNISLGMQHARIICKRIKVKQIIII